MSLVVQLHRDRQIRRPIAAGVVVNPKLIPSGIGQDCCKPDRRLAFVSIFVVHITFANKPRFVRRFNPVTFANRINIIDRDAFEFCLLCQNLQFRLDCFDLLIEVLQRFFVSVNGLLVLH